jgi:hypothetical protein
MAAIIIDTIEFEEIELDYESNAGCPVYLSSFSPVQNFDSYLILEDKSELKIYRPTSNNINLSYDVALISTREKLLLLNDLILKQAQIAKDYRKNNSTDLLQGFTFKYTSKNNTSPNVDTKVWLNSLSKNNSFWDIKSNSEKIRFNLSVTESE